LVGLFFQVNYFSSYFNFQVTNSFYSFIGRRNQLLFCGLFGGHLWAEASPDVQQLARGGQHFSDVPRLLVKQLHGHDHFPNCDGIQHG